MTMKLTTGKRIAETSSKGNQEKWREGGRWYKLDLFGYEGLAETVASRLLEHTNLVVTRETILQVVWGTDISVESRTVDMHIRTLRKKLGDAGKYICTVRKVGYKLADSEEEPEE